MLQIELFVVIMVIHIILCIAKKNQFVLLVSFITLFSQNFIAIAENSIFSAFTLLVTLFCFLLTFENVLLEKTQNRKRRK